MSRRPWLLVGLLLFTPASAPRAADRDAVTAALGRAILAPGQATAEAEDVLEARIPPMPAARTVAEWEQAAARMRAATLRDVVFRGRAVAWRDAQVRVEWLGTIAGGPGYAIKTLRYEALPGLWIPALLYEPQTLRG
ncbi:MAG TPA: hypothetical protein VF590_02810 [Isosphaeraceae bacterium]